MTAATLSPATLFIVAAALIGVGAAAGLVFSGRLWPPDPSRGARSGDIDPVNAGAVLVTTALLAMVGVGLTGPVRVLLALAFVTFVPGWALLGLLPPLKLVAGDPSTAARHLPLVAGIPKVAMAVAISLTLCTLTAQVLLWVHIWNPSALLAALGGLSLLALAVRFAWPAASSFPSPVPR